MSRPVSDVPPLPHTHDDYPDRPCPACEAEEHQRNAAPAQRPPETEAVG